MLRIEHLSKVYGDGTRALNDVSVSIADGEFVGIIGRNGAGKSTFLRCINRLIEPTAGSIWLDGVEITAAGPDDLRRIRRRIGMIVQDQAWSRAEALSGGPARPGSRAHGGPGRPTAPDLKLMLADQPLAPLDPAAARAVLSYLEQLNRREGITVICNLHTLSLARGYAGRVLAFVNSGAGGEILYDGPPDALDAAGQRTIYGPADETMPRPEA